MTEPIPAEPTAASPQNRLPLILGVAVVAGLLLFLGFRLISGGSDSSSTATTSSGSSSVRSLVRPTTTTSTPAVDESFQDFHTKNPFQPLIGAAGATPVGASSGGATSSGTSAGGTGASSSASGTSGTSSTTGAATGSAGSTAPRTTQRVALLDVFTEAGRATANVRVNDTVYKVAAGQTFATNYRAVSISTSNGCGQFVFGDEPFQLCEGQETLK